MNSVAIFESTIAVAVEAENSQANGQIVFLDLEGNIQGEPITGGALPDMLTFTPDGSKILVANEGEPNDDYSVDPEGSISIIDVATGVVTTATFTAFNSQIEELIAAGVRIFGPNATVAQDPEPEFMTFSQITITQVSGLTQIQVTSSSEVLATLPGIPVGDLDEEDFSVFEPIETPLDS